MKNNNLVFVIEDEEDLGRLMSSALENFRYEVRYFSNGVDALVAAPKENPDICIVDLNLPDMDGLELVKQFDAQQRGVIIVSGRDDLTDRVLGLEFGADDYITKPFEPRELVARVQSLLRRLHVVPKRKWLPVRKRSLPDGPTVPSRWSCSTPARRNSP